MNGERPPQRDGDLLVVNCGSSSIKLAIFDASASRRLWSGGTAFSSADAGALDRDVALRRELESLRDARRGASFIGIGHRFVHGGTAFDRPAIVDDQVETKLRALVALAPLHAPQNLAGLDAARAVWPEAAQIVCFDTTFHRTLPARAAKLALPQSFFGEGLRRFGFHGLSYEYILHALKEAGVDVGRERIVIAHLGAGSSMCALANGESIETTMGFSTVSGLPMSTRSGDIDPGAILYLLQNRNLSADALQLLLYRQSGLLGLSGLSGDMRELLARADEPGPAEAIAFFCYQARRAIGALAASLGGLDRLVFTGGVGANAPLVRTAICSELAFLGVELDAARNAAGARLISFAGAPVAVEALATDEEVMIARHVGATLDGEK